MWEKIGKFMLKLLKKTTIWLVIPLLTALLVLSVGIDIASKKGWLFEPENVKVVDLSGEKQSEHIIDLESAIKKDIDNIFADYLEYKKMPNVLYAKDSVVLMSYAENHFIEQKQVLINEERFKNLNEYKLNFVGNQQLATINLANNLESFLKELDKQHDREDKLLKHIMKKNTLSKKELTALKNEMIASQITIDYLYNKVVESYHLWTNKTAYLPYYDETVNVIDEMRKKEETLSVGIASTELLKQYKTLFDDLKFYEMNETEMSLPYELEEITSNQNIYYLGYEIYLKDLKSLQSDFKEHKTEWEKTLNKTNTMLDKETLKIILLYDTYLNNRIEFVSGTFDYYKENKVNTELYFELFEKEILLTEEKSKLNIEFDNYQKLLAELEGTNSTEEESQ